MDDIRRGAIAAKYHLSNRALAEEVDRLKALVREMSMVVEYVTRQASNEWVPLPWIQVSQEILNRPEVRVILDEVKGE